MTAHERPHEPPTPQLQRASLPARRLLTAAALSLAVAACSTPPAADCSNRSACYRFDRDGRLTPAYPPPPVEAYPILITAAHTDAAARLF